MLYNVPPPSGYANTELLNFGRNTPEGKNLPPMPSPGERMNKSVNFEQSMSDSIEDRGPDNQVMIGPDGMPMLMQIPQPEPEPVLPLEAPIMDQMKVAKEAKAYHQVKLPQSLARDQMKVAKEAQAYRQVKLPQSLARDQMKVAK